MALEESIMWRDRREEPLGAKILKMQMEWIGKRSMEEDGEKGRWALFICWSAKEWGKVSSVWCNAQLYCPVQEAYAFFVVVSACK